MRADGDDPSLEAAGAAGDADPAPDGPEAFAGNELDRERLHRWRAGPPQDWIDRVARAAPQLLESLSLTTTDPALAPALGPGPRAADGTMPDVTPQGPQTQPSMTPTHGARGGRSMAGQPRPARILRQRRAPLPTPHTHLGRAWGGASRRERQRKHGGSVGPATPARLGRW